MILSLLQHVAIFISHEILLLLSLVTLCYSQRQTVVCYQDVEINGHDPGCNNLVSSTRYQSAQSMSSIDHFFPTYYTAVVSNSLQWPKMMVKLDPLLYCSSQWPNVMVKLELYSCGQQIPAMTKYDSHARSSIIQQSPANPCGSQIW